MCMVPKKAHQKTDEQGSGTPHALFNLQCFISSPVNLRKTVNQKNREINLPFQRQMKKKRLKNCTFLKTSVKKKIYIVLGIVHI